jgi:phosphoribosylamine--glycine ligase
MPLEFGYPLTEAAMDFLTTVLIVGSGAREHALLKALMRSDRPLMTFAYPGNPGMEEDGCTLIERKMDSWEDLAKWAMKNEIDLTVVGPEVPLAEGIVDIFTLHKLTIFGPTKKAAQIEASKAFSKKLMKKHGIPTAKFEVFDNKAGALAYVRKHGAPVVVKASGLAAGKGAVVCDTEKEARSALGEIFDKKAFGEAGSSVVIEEKMEGEEASVFALTDGTAYKLLPVSQDHKPAFDGDKGPNTGGMGAYAPAPVADKKLIAQVEKQIIQPTIDAMRAEGMPYRGLLYAGIMATKEGPKVVEFNCRFGDPETQAVLPLVRCDWYSVFKACAEGRLKSVKWEVLDGACVGVVLASGGYPGHYAKGKVITGIDSAEREKAHVDVYHAGTARDKEGKLVTGGGRVLTVTAWADTLRDAIREAYRSAAKIQFDGKMFRTDIGAKGLARLAPAAVKGGK